MRRGLERFDWAVDPSRDPAPAPGPMSSGSGTCERCGAVIIWLPTPAGRTRPFEQHTHRSWDVPREYRWGITRSGLAKPAPDTPATQRVCLPHIPVCPESTVAPTHPYLQQVWEQNRNG